MWKLQEKEFLRKLQKRVSMRKKVSIVRVNKNGETKKNTRPELGIYKFLHEFLPEDEQGQV